MKKILLSILIAGGGFAANAQTPVFTENFDTFTTLATNGWTQTNQSAPMGAATWAQGGGTAFTTGGFNGGATSFALVNYTSTTGAGDISNWLITPVITLENGDVVSFYTRQGGTSGQFADRLEMRVSTTGAATTLPASSTDVGSFTTLATSVNPNLAPDVYPLTWTQFTYTVSGLTGPTACKIGFRYWVTNGGPDGANSNIIGLDALSITRTLSTDSFFKSNFAMYPNPADNVLNITSKNGISMETISITDLNGRVIRTQNVNTVSNAEINVSDLSAGVYFVSVQTADAKGTVKFVKN